MDTVIARISHFHSSSHTYHGCSTYSSSCHSVPMPGWAVVPFIVAVFLILGLAFWFVYRSDRRTSNAGGAADRDRATSTDRESATPSGGDSAGSGSFAVTTGGPYPPRG